MGLFLASRRFSFLRTYSPLHRSLISILKLLKTGEIRVLPREYFEMVGLSLC